MPHPWQFHGWAAANSPWHVHRSQRNRRVPVISFRCRQTYTATTALDTRTLLPQGAINAVPFSGHPALAISSSSRLFEIAEQIRERHQFIVVGYVVMPEHVHLLFTEPERGNPSLVLAALKQTFAHRLLP
jgi:hypothetical protein